MSACDSYWCLQRAYGSHSTLTSPSPDANCLHLALQPHFYAYCSLSMGDSIVKIPMHASTQPSQQPSLDYSSSMSIHSSLVLSISTSRYQSDHAHLYFQAKANLLDSRLVYWPLDCSHASWYHPVQCPYIKKPQITIIHDNSLTY